MAHVESKLSNGSPHQRPAEASDRRLLGLPAYGADRTGLICGFVFAPGAAGRTIGSADTIAWLREERARAPGEFAWLHFDLAANTSEKWLREHVSLPDAFYEALHEGTRSTRVEYADGSIVGVVNDALFDFAFAASDIATLWLCVGPDLIVSARRKPLRSIDRLRAAVRHGESFRSAFEILVHLMRDQGDVLVGIVRDATARVDRIEDALLADRLEARRIDLGSLRRVLVRLQRLLAPEPAALFRFLNRPPDWIGEPDVQELRHATEEFAVALNDMSALLERIKLLQEEVAAQVTEQTNRLLLLLSIVTVLGLPFTVVGGLFGMNVGGIPLNEDRNGFWVIVGVVAAVTAIGTWLLFRRRDR